MGRAPAGAIAASSRSTAATGAAAPSSAQLSPPNAIRLVPTAAWAKTTIRPSPSPLVASAQKTIALPATITTRLVITERSRILVARYCSSCSVDRLAVNRSMTQPASPNRRSSLAAGGSTARRYA